MAVPAGYTVALTINTLGVLTNALGVNTNLYQCPTCRATTLDPNAHDAWHTANAAAIKSAADAASAATKTADAAKTTAGNASTAAGQAVTTAGQSKTAADEALAMAQVALPGADVTLCPLCRATVNTNDLRVHLTYHYRRAHGDPVEFPTDFDPTTQDMAEVDPPMRVANQG